VDKLLADLRDLDARLDALLAHDDLTDDQRAEHDRWQTDRAKLTAEIKRQQARSAREGERQALEADALAGRQAQDRQRHAVAASGRLTRPDAQTANGLRIEVKPPNSLQDPKKGFKTPREFLRTVIAAGSGYGLDERLRSLRQDDGMSSLGRQLAAGSDEGRGSSDSAGGFLVPEGFTPDLLMVSPEDDPMAGRVTSLPMARPIVKIPARTDKDHRTSVSGGLTVTRKPETVLGTGSQMTLEQVTVEAFTLFGLSYASEELLTDSVISFIAILEKGFRDQFAYQLINERINGTGAGEYMGVLQSPALIAVAKQGGQAAGTLLLENLVAMRAQCWGYSKSIWIVNHDVGPQLALLNQAVGVAGVGMIWQPSAREGYPDMLLGRPLFFSEYAQALGSQGDVLLVNWSEYLEGVYQPLDSAESLHVRFLNHERAFKWFQRCGATPWWRTDLTPKNSTKHLSPYVTLAARA